MRLYKLSINLIVLSVVIWAVYYLHNQTAAWEQVKEYSLASTLLIAFLYIVLWLTNGLLLREIVKHFDVTFDFKDLLIITYVGNMLNLVLPFRGGAIMRALYLKKKHAFSYTDFIGTFLVRTILTLVVNCIFAATVLVILGVPGGIFGWVLITFCILVPMIFATLASFPPKLPKSQNFFIAKINLLLIGFNSVRKDRGLLIQMLNLVVANSMIHAIIFYIAFGLAGWNTGMLLPTLSSFFAKMSVIVNVTPGGIGIYEAMGLVSSQLIGDDFDISLLALVTLRFISIVTNILAGSIVLLTIGRKILHEMLANKDA